MEHKVQIVMQALRTMPLVSPSSNAKVHHLHAKALDQTWYDALSQAAGLVIRQTVHQVHAAQNALVVERLVHENCRFHVTKYR